MQQYVLKFISHLKPQSVPHFPFVDHKHGADSDRPNTSVSASDAPEGSRPSLYLTVGTCGSQGRKGFSWQEKQRFCFNVMEN